MKQKLLRRAEKLGTPLSRNVRKDIEIRSRSAYRELQTAWQFQHILVNHDGEDSDHWNQFYYPIGDARKNLILLAAIMRGEKPLCARAWPKNLIKALFSKKTKT